MLCNCRIFSSVDLNSALLLRSSLCVGVVVVVAVLVKIINKITCFQSSGKKRVAIETVRQTDRQADRQTDRHTQTHTDRQADRRRSETREDQIREGETRERHKHPRVS